MAKNVNAQEYVGKVLVLSDGKSKYVIKSAEGETLKCEFSREGSQPSEVSMSVSQVDAMIKAGKAEWETMTKVGEYTVKDDNGNDVTFESVAPNVGYEEVEEVSAITPTKPVAQTVDMKPKEEKRPTGRDKFVVARVPHPGESGDGPKPTKPTKTTLSEVRLVVYTTARTQQQAPRIEGFAGEDDPRWKKHYDEKQRLKDLKADAEKKNDRLRKAMKGKTKAEKEAMMAQWVVVPNDPFNASYFTDRTTGEKTYSLVMGAKYLDVAQQLVDAYNTADREAWARAEQAVAEVKSSVVAEAVAERQAKREERQAKREEARPEVKAATEQPTAAATVQGYTDKDVADMLKRIMAGEAIPENIKLAMAA